jgi:hypothetical protein
MPCGQVSATQLLASAGDLQVQARFLENESRHFSLGCEQPETETIPKRSSGQAFVGDGGGKDAA